MSVGGKWGETHGMCHSCMHSLPIVHSPPWDLACRSPLFFFSLLFLPIIFPLPNLSWRAGWYARWWGVVLCAHYYCSFLNVLLLIVFPNYYCLWIVSLFFFFYGCLKLWFPDVEVNPGSRVAPQCCSVMFTNINGLHGNRDELAIAATKFDVVAYAETKITGRRHVSKLLLPGFKAPILLLRGARPNGLSMALFVHSGLSDLRQERFECSCCEFMVAKILGPRLNCYLFVVYRSPSTDDRVLDCLCEAMGSIQSVDSKSVFCFVGDFNCHH